MESWGWMFFVLTGALASTLHTHHILLVILTEWTGHQLPHQPGCLRTLLLPPREIPRSISMEDLQDPSAVLLSQRARPFETDCLSRPLWTGCTH
jgi:hypothetical protein